MGTDGFRFGVKDLVVFLKWFWKSGAGKWLGDSRFLTVVGMYSFFICWVAISIYKVHFLRILMFLELSMLSILVTLAGQRNLTSGLPFFIVLVLAACDAAMGISVIVVHVRIYGRDRLPVESSSMC